MIEENVLPRSVELNDYLSTHEGKDAMIRTLAEALEEQIEYSDVKRDMVGNLKSELKEMSKGYKLLHELTLTILSDILVICEDNREENSEKIIIIRSYVDRYLRQLLGEEEE